MLSRAGALQARRVLKEKKQKRADELKRFDKTEPGSLSTFAQSHSKFNQVAPEGIVQEQEVKPRYLKDPSKFSGSLRSCLVFSQRVEKLTLSDTFNGFIIIIILIAGLLVGIQTYDTYEFNVVLERIDTIILGIFMGEVVLKVMAEGFEPWRYFIGPEWKWNNFDFLVVFLCLGIIDGDSSVKMLRMLRLMRVAKLVGKIPQLNMIVMGLVGGLKSIGYILALLSLVFYLYAIIGMFLFRENDAVHFRSLPVSIITLFRMATMEDWTDVMYINYYGCYEPEPHFISGFYTNNNPDANATYHYVDNVTMYQCDEQKSFAGGMVATLYFISFIFISALVMLSLFVGAVTMSMNESMESMKESAEEKARVLAYQNARKRLEQERIKVAKVAADVLLRTQRAEKEKEQKQRAAFGPDRQTQPSRLHRSLSNIHSLMGFMPNVTQSENKPKELTADELRRQRRMQLLLRSAFGEDDPMTAQEKGQQTASLETGGSDRLTCGKMYPRLADRCFMLSEHRYFQNSIMFVILWAGIMVGLQTDKALVEAHRPVFEACDNVILGIFILEATVKILAKEFEPWGYFRNSAGFDWWNCFDFAIIIGSCVPSPQNECEVDAADCSEGNSSIMPMLRLLRLLRVVKVVRSLPQLQVIVEALMNGFGSIGYVGVILVMVFYMFAVLGNLLFEDNDPAHFGNLHYAMLTLARCSTLEDWTDVMYINYYGCRYYGYGGYEHLCACDGSHCASGHVSSVYFLVFTVIGALVLMTLFIGVVTTSMEEAQEDYNDHLAVLEAATAFQLEVGMEAEVAEAYKDVFELLDVDGGGSIDEDELDLGLQSINKLLPKTEIRALMFAITGDDSREVNVAQFVRLMHTLRPKPKKVVPDSDDAKAAAAAVDVETKAPPSCPPVSDRVELFDIREEPSKLDFSRVG